ncbi:RNA polymerase sigma-70 factor, ECF subfamily [Chitinophaga costaii]|uniref:RNA polymerase sigma-70 factor, ECF subfamily n=1 Tax=Chitinophaga costaii TaxID=1335309 RepID=A0A1C4EXM3_9BACT|nr:RNA polymerase sigma factor [Chitinophaga costaii]PUZ21561.1 RNA polymerase sigma factor [Chitinophaga costaii]SCC48469.1 RNA polymerase sigma-70 factor, ECF subfamily [Chitinophaga costaii]
MLSANLKISQPDNEPSLLLRVAAGDSYAFQALVRIYKDTTYTAALRILQTRERAEDAVQDIFMKVWLNRASLPGIQNFGGWLHTVTHHQLISALRRLAREKTADLPEQLPFPTQERTVEDMLTQKEYAKLLKSAIGQLSTRQHQLYTLVREYGLSREQAAQELGISVDTVKFHLTEAHRKIRAYLMRNGDMALLLLLLIKNF